MCAYPSTLPFETLLTDYHPRAFHPAVRTCTTAFFAQVLPWSQLRLENSRRICRFVVVEHGTTVSQPIHHSQFKTPKYSPMQQDLALSNSQHDSIASACLPRLHARKRRRYLLERQSLGAMQIRAKGENVLTACHAGCAILFAETKHPPHNSSLEKRVDTKQ